MPQGQRINEKAGCYTRLTARILILGVIKFYRVIISPLKPQTCRFYPSCSRYSYDAVAQYGVCKGLYMATRRVVKCHPFHPGGFDPVE